MKFEIKHYLKTGSKKTCNFVKVNCKKGIYKIDIIKKRCEMYNEFKKNLQAEIEYNISLTAECHLRNIDIDKKFEDKMIDTSILNSKLFKDVEATAIGCGCSYILYTLVGKFGVASTGTAISTLHGIVAKNAILAKIGFGTIASGGLGIGGGLAILGIITLTPLILRKIFFDKNGNFLLNNDCTIEEIIRKETDEIFHTASEIKKVNKEIEIILGIN